MDTQKEKSVGELLREEIVAMKDEKRKEAMKQHLRYLMEEVDELKVHKEGTDKRLMDAHERLAKVTKMTLDDFDTYCDENEKKDLEGELDDVVASTSTRANPRLKKRVYSRDRRW